MLLAIEIYDQDFGVELLTRSISQGCLAITNVVEYLNKKYLDTNK
jgi:hypothetical protein